MAANKRLTIEAPLQDADALQDLLGQSVSDQWSRDAHLTIFHLGRIRDLFFEVGEVSAVTEEAFEAQIATYMERMLSRFPGSLSGSSEGTVEFESGGAWFQAVRVDPSPELELVRDEAVRGFSETIAAFGIDRPTGFIAESRAVDLISFDWLPHVTMSRSDRQMSPATWKRCPLTFGPLRIRGLD